jgi:hypothetical protein
MWHRDGSFGEYAGEFTQFGGDFEGDRPFCMSTA